MSLPEIEYLYVSRMALAGASCAHEGLTRTDVTIAMLPPGNKDFQDIARIFQLDLERLQPHLADHKLTVQSCLSALHEGYDQKYSVRLMELLEDDAFQQEIRYQTSASNEALIRYLTEIGFFDHEQIAVVDIGWLGTIQRFLYNSVKHRPDCPRLHGYVFGATRGIPFEQDLKNSLKGVIYDRQAFDLAASSILYNRDFFEEACRAPHPTIEKYELTDEGYELKFRTKADDTGQAEMEQDKFFAPLQEGIFDAAESYAASSALLGYSIEDYRPWFHYLLATKLAFAKTSEILALRHRHHLDDFYGTGTPIKKKIKGQKQLWDFGEMSLRFSPLLRTRLFWKHVRTILKT